MVARTSQRQGPHHEKTRERLKTPNYRHSYNRDVLIRKSETHIVSSLTAHGSEGMTFSDIFQ
jgi:hypothetical protein